jgi:Concanavalin A-like lectin/glucanases superfamily
MDDRERMRRTLREIVLALGAGEASREQCAAFDVLVRTDDDARTYVARIMHQQACLAWQGPKPRDDRQGLRILREETQTEESNASLPIVMLHPGLITPGTLSPGTESAGTPSAGTRSAGTQPPQLPQSPAQSTGIPQATGVRSSTAKQSTDRRRGEGSWSENLLSSLRVNWTRTSWLPLGLAAGVLVCLGISIGRVSVRSTPQFAFVSGSQVPLAPVAYLTSSMGCNWGNGSFDPQSKGDAIRNGEEVTLLEGLAQLRFESGVTLDVEGPASLLLTSRQSLVLQYGKLVVNVPPGVGELKVQLPTCRVTTTDGEFGIRAAGGDVDLHVFSGDATAALSPFEDETIPESPDIRVETVFVTSGQAITLANDDGLSKVIRNRPADKSEFATKLSMAGPLPVAEDYVKAVIDSRPFAYWRFEASANAQVPNEMGPDYPLHVLGEVRWAGDRSNRVAEFGAPGLSCALTTKERISELHDSSYSVEFWMKPSHFHHGALVSLISQPREVLDLHSGLIELRPPYLPASMHSRIRFLHREPAGLTFGTSCYSGPPYRLRSWQHLVAVKDGPAMRLYVDGQIVARGNDPTAIVVPPYVLVGQLRTNHRERAYVGQLDELAMYNRALGDAEVLAHFKAVDWKSQRQHHKAAEPNEHVQRTRKKQTVAIQGST